MPVNIWRGNVTCSGPARKSVTTTSSNEVANANSAPEMTPGAMTGNVTPATGSAMTGAFAVDLMKLETGIPLRDRHLRNNYLEVQRGPDFAVAKLVNLKVERLPGKGTIRGLLTLHGQQREVTGVADIQQQGAGYRVEASFPLRISEFQIPEPTYLGVGVKNEITIRVKLNAEPIAATTGTSIVKK